MLTESVSVVGWVINVIFDGYLNAVSEVTEVGRRLVLQRVNVGGSQQSLFDNRVDER